MKKIFIFIILITPVSLLSAQAVEDEFFGKWFAEPVVIEQEDGLLVSPSAVYSFPHLGITEMDFLDSGFVVFTVAGSEYRAFYEISVLDFDNYHINCSFRNGEEFLLKLVRFKSGWKYLYRIPEGSILKGEQEAEDIMLEEEGGENSEKTPANEELTEEVETPNASLYAGLISHK